MSTKTPPVIIDVDTGRDDAWTLISTINQTLTVKAVITSYGNAPLEDTTQQTLDTLALANSNLGLLSPQVWAGEKEPLTKKYPKNWKKVLDRWKTIGGSWFGVNSPVLSLQTAFNHGTGWEQHFLDSLDKNNKIDYVCCGPMTNLAQIIKTCGYDAFGRAKFLKFVNRVIVVGGNFEKGTPADFNFMADPEAAKIVVRALGKSLTILPFDETKKLVMTAAEIAALPQDTPPRLFTKQLMAAHANATDGVSRLHDPTALEVLKGNVPTVSRKVKVTTRRKKAGKLKLHWRGRAINCAVITTESVPTLKALVLKNMLAL